MSNGNPNHSLTRPYQGNEEHNTDIAHPPTSTVSRTLEEGCAPHNYEGLKNTENRDPERKDKGKKRALEDEGDREGESKRPVYRRSPEEEALEQSKWVLNWDLIRNYISEDPRPAQPTRLPFENPSTPSVAPETGFEFKDSAKLISAVGSPNEVTFSGYHGSESASLQDHFELLQSVDDSYNAGDEHSNEAHYYDDFAPPTPEQPQAHVDHDDHASDIDAACAASFHGRQLPAGSRDALSTNSQEQVDRYAKQDFEVAMGDSAPHIAQPSAFATRSASPRQPTPGPSRPKVTPQPVKIHGENGNGSHNDARTQNSVRLPSGSFTFRAFSPVVRPSQPQPPALARTSFTCQWHQPASHNTICGQIFSTYNELVAHLESENGHKARQKNSHGRCSCWWLERDEQRVWTKCKHYENGLANYHGLKKHLKKHQSLKTGDSAFVLASPKKPKASKRSGNQPRQARSHHNEGTEAI